jgi:hypothetical protein
VLAVELRVAELIPCLLYQLLVVGNFGAERCQQIADDSRIDTYIKRFPHRFFAQLRASAGKAEAGGGVDEAEKGDCYQHLFLRERLPVFQRSTRNGAEQVDRYGLYSQLFQGEGEFDTLFQRFAHTDDAAAANIHACIACGL